MIAGPLFLYGGASFALAQGRNTFDGQSQKKALKHKKKLLVFYIKKSDLWWEKNEKLIIQYCIWPVR
jgi:uncharacterized protein YneR